MTKNDFIGYMNSSLAVLNSDEIDDIISEYTQHIDNKIAEGMTEEEAVKSLGSIEDIVRDILSAYSVDPDYNRKEHADISKTIKTTAKGCFSAFCDLIKNIGDWILNQRFSTLLAFLIKVIIMVFVLGICFMIGAGIVGIIGEFISNIIFGGNIDIIVNLLLITYTVIAFPTCAYVLVRFMAHSTGIKRSPKKPVDHIKDDTEREPIFYRKKNIDYASNSNSKNDDEFGFLNIILKIVAFFVKALIMICMIPCVVALFFTLLGLGVLLVMFILGYPVLGPMIACFGLDLAGISLLAIVIAILFYGKGVEAKDEKVL